jgi:hypothetical protein
MHQCLYELLTKGSMCSIVVHRGLLHCHLEHKAFTVNRIRMSPTPTLNIYLFEGPIYTIVYYHYMYYLWLRLHYLLAV